MFSLLEAAHALEGRLEEALAPIGLSMAKQGVLSQLVQAREPLMLSELAAGHQCVRSNMTQLVDRLEAEGLLVRTDDPKDRRVVRAALTPLGADRQAAGAEQIARVQAKFLASLTKSDREALERVLSGLK